MGFFMAPAAVVVKKTLRHNTLHVIIAKIHHPSIDEVTTAVAVVIALPTIPGVPFEVVHSFLLRHVALVFALLFVLVLVLVLLILTALALALRDAQDRDHDLPLLSRHRTNHTPTSI